MADRSENILVEFDYDNITLIDPNKVVDNFGKVNNRLVKQEDLVYYANLECSVLPRTKLAVGAPFNDRQRTISVGKINFLNPGFKDFLNTRWTDELTGKDTLQGRGVNQKKLTAVKNPDKSNDYYFTQSTYSNGKTGSVDTGMLGIKDINISMGQDFLPVVEITLEDVKGRTLFEAGNNSPYAAFFQLPYPIFNLTLKGYYGKAIKYPLMLQSFTSNFDPSSHNFLIRLKFYGYKYTLLSYVNFGALMAVPHMYKNLITTTNSVTVTNQTEKSNGQTPSLISRGYEKMKEIYSDYKSKGLIADDFPEITLNQLKYKLDEFIKNILEQFTKNNLGVLTDMSNYSNSLLAYQQTIFLFAETSWFKKYMDFERPFILTNGQKVYIFKDTIKAQDRPNAITDLESRITKYNAQLASNSVFGTNPGTYTVGGITYPSKIDNAVESKNNFIYQLNPKTDIDWIKSFQYINPTVGSVPENDPKFINFYAQRLKIAEDNVPDFFWFEGPGSFIDITNKINKDVESYKKQIEEKILANLKEQFNNRQTGLGFVPTLRNVLAVFYCQGEAFLRLLDEVHQKAWDQRSNPYRKAAIFGGSVTAPSVDVKTSTQNDEPIYPWPQVIKESIGTDGDEKFEIVYPGAGDIALQYRAYTPEIWPEVEFVEEFIKGYTYRDSDFTKLDSNETNLLNKPRRISLNSIDFPVSNQVYQNKQQSKYFYEIYERVILNAYYSKLSRASGYANSIYNVEAEDEAVNILESLGSTNPYLSKILKEYQIDQTNFEVFLRHISNEGQGESWQEFIRGYFVTPYIKNEVENPNKIYNKDILTNVKSQPDVNFRNDIFKTNIENFIKSSSSNVFDFTDIYPITDLSWDKTYLANGSVLNSQTEAFDTKKTLEFSDVQKTVTNFDLADSNTSKKPFSNFNYTNIPQQIDNSNLLLFYTTRTIPQQVTTEGNVFYKNYNGNLTANQTTSILNTPYFINAIQDGVYKFRYDASELSPYKTAALLFLESLPLSTTKERYKTLQDNSSNELDYIISTVKKFGAVHKLPYAWILKYGGIWHRYKTWIETGVDILDTAWNNFNYIRNFDPVSSATTANYPLIVNGQQRNITLDNTSNSLTNINVGFYPQLLDDYNVFIQGTKLLSGTSLVQGICSITGTTMTVDLISSNSLFIGAQISGPNIAPNSIIINQITGANGGIGEYIISPSQSASTNTFTITNFIFNGPSAADMQTLLNDESMILINAPGSNINLPQGFDTGSPTRSLKLNAWSVALRSNTNPSVYYTAPSFGSNVNQTKNECFVNNFMEIEVSQNKSMFNGSVRLYWNAPQYGYFNNSQVSKNSPDTYLKTIFSNITQQENFRIDGDSNKYSKIDDMFSSFDKELLDLFEYEFLNFSKSIYDYEDTIPPTLNFSISDLTQQNVSTLSSTESLSEKSFKNFQQLMRELMKINKPTGTSPTDLLNSCIVSQNATFDSVLKNFLLYDVVLKIGNPSGFNRRTFYTFSTQFIADPIKIDPYISGTLPGDGFVPSVSLASSKTQNPESWKALETYVGFSEIPKLKYDNNGSYITDFFITMNVGFNEKNIADFAPLIKIFATQKLYDNNLSYSDFLNLMDEYLLSCKSYLDNVISVLMPSVRKELPTVVISTQEGSVRANLEAGFTEQTRVELWETFKALNDTWISGYDFSQKTLFEDVLLMDRASRDVGNKIIVDIFEIKNILEGSTYKNTLLGIVEGILKDNNFVTYMLPSYINFYNVQNVQKNPVPKTEGSAEFANSMFGTFLNVDYRESSPKYVCIYASKPSEHLAMNENIDYRFRDDAFDLRRASDNPLIENQLYKTDWDKSNKIVGFNVDPTLQNQQIFKQFDVAQDPGKPTSESLEVLNQMANLSKNRRSSTQNVSLYNLYKNRSYRCSVDMMGNALIQPTMYFNVRNVPMFSGPYMITSVKHRISENGFDTVFEGIRQPFYSLPRINNFIQSLNENILTSIQTRIQEDQNKLKSDPKTVIAERNNIISNIEAEETLTANQNCSSEINPYYAGYTQVDTPLRTNYTFRQVYATIKNSLIQKGYTDTLDLYATLVYTFLYVDSSTTQGFEAYENNFSTISLKDFYGASFNDYVNRKYFCVNRGNNINYPIVSFIDLPSFVEFAITRTNGILSNQITTTGNANEELAETYVRYYPTQKNENVWTTMTESDKQKLYNKFKKAIESYNSVKN